MLKEELLVHLDQHGRVIINDAELEAMIAAEDIPLAGGLDYNGLCNNDTKCEGSLNTSCANYPGKCIGSTNGSCNPNHHPK